ncbi:nucleotide-diphospho-sugar transferase [Hysterangium stoloniferum]|nr:nucleotide-diphospho-sugar transferase [Hysterangium stoloniferum]
MPVKRRTLTVLLTLLALFLFGTVVVLSTISFYLRIDLSAYITPEELTDSSNNSTDHRTEFIPRIIHQTWKTETLPDRWKGVSQSCRDLMPDYKYMLWTDASSREFIEREYPWFLPTFDAYTYPIQRADAIRYFVLHYYGGVYLDLDVGCLRSLDPLLTFPVILPKTIPVGVSNDLMFSQKGHPFMEQTIRNLITFDLNYVLNYPTVMFSTGPMFLSAQYGLYTASHPPSPDRPGGDVRILPKSLYGKNAKPEEAPHSFFSHHYGSSWHADDAAFITFLGNWGKGLMWVGLVVLVIGIIRLLLQRQFKPHHGERSRRRFAFGRYDVVLPRAFQRDGRFHLDLGFVTVAESSGHTEPPSPTSSLSSDSSQFGDHHVSPLSLDSRAPSPSATSDVVATDYSGSLVARLAHATRRAGFWIRASVAGPGEGRARRHRSRNRGVMYFLPAIFTHSPRPAEEHDVPLLAISSLPQRPGSRSRTPTPFKHDAVDDVILSGHDVLYGRSRPPSDGSSTAAPQPPPPPPPPYENRGVSRPWTARDGSWEEWTGEETV